jgi:CRISPR-associated protein Cas1
LLTGLSVAALLQARLVPTLSYLHALDGARPSLAFDLMEEFRAPIVEQLALELLRRSSLSTESFESSEDGGVLLTREGRRVYFTALEARLGDTFNAPHLSRTLSYRDAINAQAEHLSRVIRGVDPFYTPIEWST